MLGGDRHAARVTLNVALPSKAAWTGGARRFRCDLSWAEFTAAGERAHRQCMAFIADFAAVSYNSELPYRAGSIFYPPSRREWEEDDRGVRCFLWSDDRKLTRSMRGVGPQGLPAI